jgi:hypothetical protein
MIGDYFHVKCHYQNLIDIQLDQTHSQYVHPTSLGNRGAIMTPARRWAASVRPAALPAPGRPGVFVCLRPALARWAGYAAQTAGGAQAMLASVLTTAGPGVRLNEHCDDLSGDVVFRHACQLGYEGANARFLFPKFFPKNLAKKLGRVLQPEISGMVCVRVRFCSTSPPFRADEKHPGVLAEGRISRRGIRLAR